MNNSKVLNNFMRTAVEGAKTLAKEIAPLSPKGRYAGDGGSERDNIFRQKARFEAGLKKEAEGKLRAVLPNNLMQRTADAEGAARLKVQIEAAKAAGVAGPVIAMAEKKLSAFVMGEENREVKQADRLRKESAKAELASPEGMARKAAEDQLRTVYPFPSMTADPARLKPAIEAAKQAGVAAPIVAMAMVKLKEAEDSPSRSLSLAASSQMEKASSALESTANALQNFQEGVANWSMPSWDEGVTITVGDTTVRGRGLSLLAMPVAVMGLVVKRRSSKAIEEAEGSLRRSRIVRAWDAERREWIGSDTASVASSDDEKPTTSPYLLCVRGGKHLDSSRATAEDRATAAGRSASLSRARLLRPDTVERLLSEAQAGRGEAASSAPAESAARVGFSTVAPPRRPSSANELSPELDRVSRKESFDAQRRWLDGLLTDSLGQAPLEDVARPVAGRPMLAQALGDDEPLARSRSAPVNAREPKRDAGAATLLQLAGVDKKKPRSSLGRFWPMSPKSLNSSTSSPEDTVDNGETSPSSPAQMIRAWFAKSKEPSSTRLSANSLSRLSGSGLRSPVRQPSPSSSQRAGSYLRLPASNDDPMIGRRRLDYPPGAEGGRRSPSGRWSPRERKRSPKSRPPEADPVRRRTSPDRASPPTWGLP
jgi:hypothetical protein